MKLTIGFSPCPNDTFIFDALINQKIDTEGIEFEAILEDVETLNQWALEGKLVITKLSLPAFFQSTNKYVLMDAGSALGKGVGPLLVKNKQARAPMTNLQDTTIALPGKNTTANLLFSFAYPEAHKKIFMRFDNIEDYVLSSAASPSSETLGVIIHENRFTYGQKGLEKVADLGEIWETRMNVPIPLGSIAIKKDIDRSVCLQVEKLIRKSLEHAFAAYPAVPEYVKRHAQTMSEEVMRRHIELYVNDFSLSLGNDGRNAILALQNIFASVNKITVPSVSGHQIFLSDF